MAHQYDARICRVVKGRNVPLHDEKRKDFGDKEGTWWTKWSWWVIPLGTFVLFGSILHVFGVWGSGSSSTPVVIQYQAPSPSSVPAVNMNVPDKIKIELDPNENSAKNNNNPREGRTYEECRDYVIWTLHKDPAVCY